MQPTTLPPTKQNHYPYTDRLYEVQGHKTTNATGMTEALKNMAEQSDQFVTRVLSKKACDQQVGQPVRVMRMSSFSVSLRV